MDPKLVKRVKKIGPSLKGRTLKYFPREVTRSADIKPGATLTIVTDPTGKGENAIVSVKDINGRSHNVFVRDLGE